AHRSLIDTIFLNPFYLDESSLLLKHPERYGIKNVRRIDERATPDKIEDVRDTYYYKYAYDEIDGLDWERKKRQIVHSHRELVERVPGAYWNNETVALLFHLYDVFEDKAAVRQVYQRWSDLKRSRQVSALAAPA